MLSYLLTIVYFQIPILNSISDNDDYFFQYSNGYYSMKNRLCRRNGLSVNNYQNNSTFSSITLKGKMPRFLDHTETPVRNDIFEILFLIYLRYTFF